MEDREGGKVDAMAIWHIGQPKGGGERERERRIQDQINYCVRYCKRFICRHDGVHSIK
jgi:hypothetical protein